MKEPETPRSSNDVDGFALDLRDELWEMSRIHQKRMEEATAKLEARLARTRNMFFGMLVAAVPLIALSVLLLQRSWNASRRYESVESGLDGSLDRVAEAQSDIATLQAGLVELAGDIEEHGRTQAELAVVLQEWQDTLRASDAGSEDLAMKLSTLSAAADRLESRLQALSDDANSVDALKRISSLEERLAVLIDELNAGDPAGSDSADRRRVEAPVKE